METSVLPSILTIFADIRAFVNNGLTVLPLTIIGTGLLLSLMTANYALLFMIFGMIFIAPSGLFIINALFDFIGSFLGQPTSRLFAGSYSDLCDVIPPFPIPSRPSAGLKYTFGSYWLAMMSFFFGYILSNAVALLQKTTDEPADADDKVRNMFVSGVINRKTQAILAMITTILLIVLVVASRLINTTCEPYISSIFSVLAFGALGYGIYTKYSTPGDNRLSDIFGIANRLLSPSAMNNAPYACLPTKTAP
jgi:hypothetical protein